MNEQSPPEGWYPVDDLTERMWTGDAWGDATRPRQAPAVPSPAVQTVTAVEPATGKSAVVTAGVVAVSILGFILAIQSASLLTGTGTIWTGVAIAVGAAVFAFILKAQRWVRVVVVLVALVAVGNAISVEVQLEERRSEFRQLME